MMLPVTILSEVYELQSTSSMQYSPISITSWISGTNIFHCTLQNYESESSAISILNFPAQPKLNITFLNFLPHSTAKLVIVLQKCTVIFIQDNLKSSAQVRICCNPELLSIYRKRSTF
jgi:hypothetical protein